MSNKKKMLFIFPVLLVFIVGSIVWYMQERWELPVLRSLPEVALPTIEGGTYSFQESNKVKFVSFIFTHCPAICPMTTAEMTQLQKRLSEQGVKGDKLEFISITIDPKRDTPQVLQQYRDQFNIDSSHWLFLRGSEEQTKETTLAFSFWAEDTGDGDISHSTTTYVVDQKNRVRAFHGMGNDFNEEEIIKNILSLL